MDTNVLNHKTKEPESNSGSFVLFYIIYNDSIYMLKFILSFCLFFIGFGVFAQQSPFGINLSGMEWVNGNNGSNVPTQDQLNYYAGKGLKLIRLPILWEYVQPTLDGPLDQTYLGYIDSVVVYATRANVSIIIDVHNYCRYPYNGSVINTTGGPTIAQFGNLWTRLASHFATQTTVWGYDLMNEPNNLGKTATNATNYWFPMAQAAIDSIRKVDNIHFILVEGEFWAHADLWVKYNETPSGNRLRNLVDINKKLVFEAHQYFDSDGSGRYGGNGATNTSPMFSTFPNNVNKGVTAVTPFVNWLKQYGLKGYLGEFGVPNSAYNSSPSDVANWNTLLKNMYTYLQANCVLATYWSGGISWPYTNYVISAEPTSPVGGTDASQMPTLESFKTIPSTCTGWVIGGTGGVGLTGLLNSAESQPNFSVYPNPTSNSFSISGLEGEAQISLFDLAGYPVFESFYNGAPLQVSNISKGIYTLRIVSKGKAKNLKVVIE